MTTKYYALLTNPGAAKLANAAALGTKLQITHMAVGDGGGTLPTPNASQTALVGEKRRAALNSLSVDAANSSQIIAEQVIPEAEGGFWIREIGLFDADGVMIAVANCAETYKPQLQEGSGRTQTVRMIIIMNSADAVTLKIDPSVVLATRKYVDDAVIEVKAYADGLMAAHLKSSDPHTQYAPKASPTLTGIPKAPTAAAGNSSTQLATTAFVQAALAALAGGAPAALDTLKELADALGGDANFSATVLNALAGKMEIAKNGSDIANVAEFLKNLGLGEAAKRAIGTAENQIPDMNSFGFRDTAFS
ncbi:phage tail protein, partial [Pantoea sp. 3_1284]|uniref:phage tail protein n=1 Tax=Pantoea sp. 3_1284 TaxID=2259618 RepID=UPI000DE3A156